MSAEECSAEYRLAGTDRCALYPFCVACNPASAKVRVVEFEIVGDTEREDS